MKKHNIINFFLNYFTNIAMIGVLVVGTFFLPKLYSYRTDIQVFNVVHPIKREALDLETGVAIPKAERLGAILDAANDLESLKGGNSIAPVLTLKPEDIQDETLISGIREEVERGVDCGLLPDIRAYDLENNILEAKFYTLGNKAEAGGDMSLWVVHSGDYKTFDFTFMVDASSYLIYYAELCSTETGNYWTEFDAQKEQMRIKDNTEGTEVVENAEDAEDAENTGIVAMAEEFMNACESYYGADEVTGTGIDNLYQVVFGEVGRVYCLDKSSNEKKNQIAKYSTVMGFDVLRRNMKGMNEMQTVQEEQKDVK